MFVIELFYNDHLYIYLLSNLNLSPFYYLCVIFFVILEFVLVDVNWSLKNDTRIHNLLSFEISSHEAFTAISYELDLKNVTIKATYAVFKDKYKRQKFSLWNKMYIDLSWIIFCISKCNFMFSNIKSNKCFYGNIGSKRCFLYCGK